MENFLKCVKRFQTNPFYDPEDPRIDNGFDNPYLEYEGIFDGAHVFVAISDKNRGWIGNDLHMEVRVGGRACESRYCDIPGWEEDWQSSPIPEGLDALIRAATGYGFCRS